MSARARSISSLTGGLIVAVLAAGAAPAHAQGDPVGGKGNHYYLAGAGNTSGKAVEDFFFGDAGDQVYFGDFVDETGAFGGDGEDDAMVRRGRDFTIRGQSGRVFSYGDPGDTVLIGDWNGDGTDTLAVRRGNRFFIKNDVNTGVADYTFDYGDAGDTVLVGNWDGDTSAVDAEYVVTTDTLAVRRGNRFFIKNDTRTGVADYVAAFGDPGDTILVGDWATAPTATAPGVSGDYADQLAVRRGNVYYTSQELAAGAVNGKNDRPIVTTNTFAYGEVTDTAFTALVPVTYTVNGADAPIAGDGLAVRRNG